MPNVTHTLYQLLRYDSQLKPCRISSKPLPAAGPEEVAPPACTTTRTLCLHSGSLMAVQYHFLSVTVEVAAVVTVNYSCCCGAWQMLFTSAGRLPEQSARMVQASLVMLQYDQSHMLSDTCQVDILRHTMQLLACYGQLKDTCKTDMLLGPAPMAAHCPYTGSQLALAACTAVLPTLSVVVQPPARNVANAMP